MSLVIFVAIILIAAAKPKWVFPLLIPVGLTLATIAGAIFLLGATMGAP